MTNCCAWCSFWFQARHVCQIRLLLGWYHFRLRGKTYPLFHDIAYNIKNANTKYLFSYSMKSSWLAVMVSVSFYSTLLAVKVKPRKRTSNDTLDSANMHRYWMLSQRYDYLFTVTFTHSLLSVLHHFASYSQSLQGLLVRLFISVAEELFGPVSRHPLNVKLLWRCDVWQSAVPRQQPGLSMLESTRPKDKPARRVKPGALIIHSGDSCLWQINVFYNSTLAFHCNLSWREEQKKRSCPLICALSPQMNRPPKTKCNLNGWMEIECLQMQRGVSFKKLCYITFSVETLILIFITALKSKDYKIIFQLKEFNGSNCFGELKDTRWSERLQRKKSILKLLF